MPFVLIRVVNTLFNLYSYVLIAYALISWFPNAQQTTFAHYIRKLSEPYLSLFQRFSIGPIGFSVIIGLIVLRFAQIGVINIIVRLLTWF